MRLGLTSWTTLACLALSGCDAIGPQRGGGAAIDAGTFARGQRLFLEHCALCHGERGDGRGPRRGSLSRPPADFRSPRWRTGASRERVRHAIRDGVPGTDMPPWSRLGEEAVDDLTAYVLALGSPPSDEALVRQVE